MGMVCELCGDIGAVNAWIYCFKCQVSMRHCYCLDVLPESFDDTDSILWACEDCQDVPQLLRGRDTPTNTAALTFSKGGEDKDTECNYFGTTTLKEDLAVEDLEHHVEDCPNVVPEVELLMKGNSNTSVTRVGAMNQKFQETDEDCIPLNQRFPTPTVTPTCTQAKKSIAKKAQRKRKVRPSYHVRGSKKQKNAGNYPKTITRNSPKLLSDMITRMSKAQKEWIKAAGFGSLLQFSLTKLPHIIGYMLVTSYNHEVNEIQLDNGKISICDQDVENILGLPRGTRPVQIGKKKRKSTQTEEWRDQFPDIEKKCTISTKNVCQKMAESKEVNHLFKLNFLVAMENILIKSNENGYANHNLLNFTGEVDECAKYNWCAYLIKNLKESKIKWAQTKCFNVFTGPLTFLTLLYVDRVVVNCEPTVERASPAFLKWRDDELHQREQNEVKNNLMGKGTVRTRVYEAEGKEKDIVELMRCADNLREKVSAVYKAERKYKKILSMIPAQKHKEDERVKDINDSIIRLQTMRGWSCTIAESHQQSPPPSAQQPRQLQ